MQCHKLAGVPQPGCGGGGGGLGEGGGGDGDGSAEGEPQSSSTRRVRMPPVSRREYLSIPQTELQTGGRHITTNRRTSQTAQARSESTTINTTTVHITRVKTTYRMAMCHCSPDPPIFPTLSRLTCHVHKGPHSQLCYVEDGLELSTFSARRYCMAEPQTRPPRAAAHLIVARMQGREELGPSSSPCMHA